VSVGFAAYYSLYGQQIRKSYMVEADDVRVKPIFHGRGSDMLIWIMEMIGLLDKLVIVR
jgi:hypothetical protein